MNSAKEIAQYLIDKGVIKDEYINNGKPYGVLIATIAEALDNKLSESNMKKTITWSRLKTVPDYTKLQIDNFSNISKGDFVGDDFGMAGSPTMYYEVIAVTSKYIITGSDSDSGYNIYSRKKGYGVYRSQYHNIANWVKAADAKSIKKEKHTSSVDIDKFMKSTPTSIKESQLRSLISKIIKEELQSANGIRQEGSIKNLQLEFSEIVSQILGKDAEVQMANVMGNTVLIVKNEQLDQSVRQDIEDEFNYQTDGDVLIRGHQVKGADTAFILKQ